MVEAAARPPQFFSPRGVLFHSFSPAAKAASTSDAINLHMEVEKAGLI